MSSRNDENSAVGAGLALVGAGLIAIAVFAFAVLAFLSLVFTILSLFAWNRPLTMGNLHIEPHEARMFIGRGLMAGAFAVLFLVLVDLVPDIAINWNYWLVYWAVGYVGGSIGLELLFMKSRTDAPVTDQVAVEQLPPPPISQRPRVEPMRFATWDDDEDERR